jgi:hypothetical protein
LASAVTRPEGSVPVDVPATKAARLCDAFDLVLRMHKYPAWYRADQ